MFKRLLTLGSAILFCVSVGFMQTAMANTPDLNAEGYWITLDHQNNNHQSSVIRITKDANGDLSGKIVHIFPELGHSDKDKCLACKGALHNAPILGLRLVWGFHEVGAGNYTGGYVLDPTIGKVYKCTMHVSPDGQRLTVHGYIGIPLFGRSDVWLRTHPVVTAKVH